MKILKKIIAITYGDPLGIGLEILNSLLKNHLILPFQETCDFVIFGDQNILTIPNTYDSFVKVNHIPVKNTSNSADHSFQCLEIAINFCSQVNQQKYGLVTGPVSKDKWIKAGHNWTGQTELLGSQTKSSPEMLFIAKDWKILLLTRHIPLKEVSQAITKRRFKEAITTLQNFLYNKYNLSQPKIALAGINPHAGENGKIGTEEKEYLSNWCKEFNISGPFSPDDIWTKAGLAYLNKTNQEFDAYLAPYHDQLLPLLKTITHFQAVNVSIGLPFIRTSPDHGTAFHLVGTNKADTKPFLEAIRLCEQLTT